ncbi:MAG: HAD family hydrolase [Candidatus Bathyarchaeia archaeon]
MVDVAILDMDGTILSKRSIDVICERFSLTGRLKEIDRRFAEAPRYMVTRKISRLLTGMNVKDLEEAFDSIPPNENVDEFVAFLKDRGFIVAIATDGYKFLADRLKSRLNLDLAYGNILEINGGVLTGKVVTQPGCLKIPGCRQYSICKLRLLKSLQGALGGWSVAVGDGDSDYCMFEGADIPIAFRPRTERLMASAATVVQDFSEATEFLRERLGRGLKYA